MTLRATIAHALACHRLKLLTLITGLLTAIHGWATRDIGALTTGSAIGGFALSQLATYWRHDHADCDHPACRALGGENA